MLAADCTHNLYTCTDCTHILYTCTGCKDEW